MEKQIAELNSKIQELMDRVNALSDRFKSSKFNDEKSSK